MHRSTRVLTLTAAALIATGCKRAEAPEKAAQANAVGAAEAILVLPDSTTAVPMQRPILPARVAGDCPGPDKCEFGTNWQTCKAIAVYRDAKIDAPILRMLKPLEKFVAESGEIEIHAPGQVEITGAVPASQTGGLALAAGTMLEAYGPLQQSRALYYDPGSGKGWSPEAAADHWWWDGETSRLVSAPIMTWWVKVRLGDGQQGWLKLRSDEDLSNFPIFNYDDAVLTWNVDIERDDESPGCDTVLAERKRNDPTL